jgi:hypothetical protein
MSGSDAARVDVAVLRAAARGYDEVGDDVARARARLARLTFDGSVAGRSHRARGDALRQAIARLDGALAGWADRVADTASALRAGADRYAQSDLDAARGLG